MATLTKANNEWSKRAPDERFASVAQLHAAAMNYRQLGKTASVPFDSLRVVAQDGDLLMQGATGARAKLTNWSFGQLANRAEAPAGYLRELPAELAATCLNHGISRVPVAAAGQEPAERSASLLFKHNGDLTLRALTSDRYERVWNSDVTSRLLELEANGPWQPAPEAFDGSRGLYLSDRDMFAFMVDNNRRIFETDKGGGLSRGFFVWNSEVGARSFGIQTFLYEYVCGNHRVWGASNVKEFSVRHVGQGVHTAFAGIRAQLIEYADSAAADDELKIKACRTFQIGKTKEEVLDAVFRLRVPQLGKKLVERAYELAEMRTDWYGSPRSAWGLAGGLTEIARDLPNADDRTALDRASVKVMEMAF